MMARRLRSRTRCGNGAGQHSAPRATVRADDIDEGTAEKRWSTVTIATAIANWRRSRKVRSEL